jgi:dephospho-CoA kinase
LAVKVFGNDVELAALEAMIHPRVREAIDAALVPGRLNVIAVPLLFEKGWAERFDLTVAVWSTPEQQRRRLAARGWTEAESAARLAAQMCADEKLKRADHGLINDRDLQHLKQQIAELLTSLSDQTGKTS